MFALALDLWQPAVISGAGRAQWLANLAGRFGGVTPDVYVDFITKQAYQAGQPSVLVPDDALNCVSASTRYRDDSLGNWLSFAPNVLAYTNKGLRVWEARTNGIRNNSMQGAVVGTPGTLPTNWVQSQNTGIVPAVAGIGTDNGIDYVDIKVTGTTAGGAQINIVMEGTNAIVAASGQTWTSSIFFRLVGGSTANLNQINHSIQPLNAAQAGLASTTVVIPAATVNTWTSMTRVTNTGTLGDATTAYVHSLFTFTFAAAPVAVDITLRVGWPQLEQAPFTSPPIRTTSAAVTTAAEVVTLTHALTFGGAYSLYAAGIPAATLAYANPQAIIQSDTGVDAQSIALRRNNGTGTASAVLTGGTGGSLVGAAWSQNAAGKLAAAVSAADQAISFNGAAVVTAALAALPTTPTGVHAGGQSSTNQWDGDIGEFAIWATTRIPNSGLITGTQ
jgi:hypothetical protein